MSEVIQPAPGQTVITTDQHSHHRDHGHRDDRRHDELRTDADYRSLIGQGSVNGDRITSGVQVTGDRISTVGAAGALASGHTDQLVLEGRARGTEVVQAGFGGVHDRICDSTGKVVGALNTGFTASALASCKTDDGVQAVGKDAVTLAKDNLIAMNVGFSAVNTQAAAIGSAAQVLATAFANQAQVTATQNFNLLTGQATDNVYKVLLDSQKNAAAAQLEAEKNANAQALAMCKCCGELTAQADRNTAIVTAQAAANLAAITATSVAGTQRILDRMCDDKNADLRAQLVATQRLIPVTIPVGAG